VIFHIDIVMWFMILCVLNWWQHCQDVISLLQGM